MVTVKLTTPWPHDYYKQTPEGKGLFGQFKFEINNDCDYCDWWIIWGGVLSEENVAVREGRVIYITDEAHERRLFNGNFLSQFPRIASVRTDLKRKDVIQIPEISPWYFNKTYDHLLQLNSLVKSKEISIICSDLTWLDGHKKRFAFVNRLIGHFKDKIDVYGRGFNEILDKYDGLIDYKYSVAIENNRLPGYFTEKISECFLTYTVPIYYGAPDIGDFYNNKSILNIDIGDYKEAINAIEEVLASDSYAIRLPHLIDARKTYFDNYHVFAAIIKLIKMCQGTNSQVPLVKKVRIIPENRFLDTGESSNHGRFRETGNGFIKSIFKKLYSS